MQAWAHHRPGTTTWSTPTTGSPARRLARRPALGRAPGARHAHHGPRSRTPNLAAGDTPEPAARVIGETQIVTAGDRLIANYRRGGRRTRTHYTADPGKVAVVHPGVNLSRFRPADGRAPPRGPASASRRTP
ncbi:hypothetical protein GCM10023238_24130 [Streptomyces heliomycini]